LRNRPRESANNPTITPNTIASTGNPGTADCGAAAEVDSEWVDDEVGTVFVVVDVTDVVDGNVGPEDVEVELVVVDDIGLGISLSKTAAE